MFSDYKTAMHKFTMYFIHKSFKSFYEKIVVDDHLLQNIRKLEQNSEPMILVPTHRSYVDLLILPYVLYAYKMQGPLVATSTDFLNMTLINKMIR